jgi:hypothetical protein
LERKIETVKFSLYSQLWGMVCSCDYLIQASKYLSAYIKKTERSQINDLMIHLKLLEKQEQENPETNRREIIKIRAEINEIEIKNTQN